MQNEARSSHADLLATANVPRLTVSEFDAAEALGVSVYFLRKDRRTKRIIPFSRIGDRVVYNVDRLRATLCALEEGGAPVKGRKPKRESAAAA